MLKRILIVLTFFVVSTAFASQEVAVENYVFNGTGKMGGKLVLSLINNPKTFNPITMTDVPTSEILLTNMYTGLLDYDYETLQDDLYLLKKMDVSPDGLQYTMTLRKGLTWSDGHPFTVDDVLFTYQVVTDPKVLTSSKDGIKQSDGTYPKLEKLDNLTLRFTLKEINVLFTSNIASTYIIPKHKWEKIYLAGDFMNAMITSTNPEDMPTVGPYTLEKFVPDQRVVLKRNPYYFKIDKNGQRLPYLDKVVYLITPDLNAKVLRFQNGEVDMHEVMAPDYDLLKREEKQKGYTVYELGPSHNVNFVYFNLNDRVSQNTGKPFVEPKKLKVFSNKNFRQAVSYAIDREGLVKTAFHGRATPIYNFYSPGNKIWYNPGIPKYPFDLEKAKALLAEMGLKDQNGDGYLEYEDGSPIEFSLKTNAENPTRIQIGNLLKEDLKKIGFKVDLEPVPFNNLIQDMSDTFDYDAIILSWGSAVPPDPAMSHNVLHSSGRMHAWNPRQEKPATEWEQRMDDFIALNQGTLDMAKRKEYFNEVQKIWGEELPQIMTIAVDFYVAVKDKFGNVKPSALRPYYSWNIEEIYDKTVTP